MNRKALICLVLFLVIMVVGWPFFRIFFYLFLHNFVPESTFLELPNDGIKVKFTRKGDHPFLAEYTRRIKVSVKGKVYPEIVLPLNYGYGTYINVYRIETENGVFLRLQDPGGEYLLDPTLNKLYLIAHVHGKDFIGELKSEKDSLSWSMFNSD